QEPVLLLLDEPTQGLSSAETAATVAVIRRIARERHLTILLVEHDMDVVFNLADRVTVLNFGQVIAEGSPAEVRANVDVQTAYLGETPSLLAEQARRAGGPWTHDALFEYFPILRQRWHQKARSLSGGEQQMLAIARALAGNPAFVMLDEPSQGLAPLLVRELGSLMLRLKR